MKQPVVFFICTWKFRTNIHPDMHKIWYCQKGRQECSPTNSLTIGDSIKLPDFNGYIKIGTQKIPQIFRRASRVARQISEYANGKWKSTWLIFCPICIPITLSNKRLGKNDNPRQLKLEMAP